MDISKMNVGFIQSKRPNANSIEMAILSQSEIHEHNQLVAYAVNREMAIRLCLCVNYCAGKTNEELMLGSNQESSETGSGASIGDESNTTGKPSKSSVKSRKTKKDLPSE